MPDATFLHIQARDAGTARVMELSGAPVRVGRGPACEVRLAEPALADVQCILRPRGATWQVCPIGPPGRVHIDGRAVEQPRAIPPDTPLRIGDAVLILSHSGAARLGPGSFDAPIPAGPDASIGAAGSSIHPAAFAGQPYDDPTARVARPSAPNERERIARWQARNEHRERFLKARKEERRWEARWKAAGESLKRPGIQPVPPSVEPPDSVAPANSIDPIPEPEPTRFDERFSELPTLLALPAPAPAPRAIEADSHIRPDDPRILPFVPMRAEPELAAIEPAAIEAAESFKFEPEQAAEPIEEDSTPAVTTKSPRPVEKDRPAPRVEPDSPRVAPEPRVGTAWTVPSPYVAHTAQDDLPSWNAADPGGGATGISPAATPTDAAYDEMAWPSARSILEAAGAGRKRTVDADRPRVVASDDRRPKPTTAAPPNGWTLPTWVAVGPGALLAVAVGIVGMSLAWTWSRDDRAAGLLADRLLAEDRLTEDPVEIPSFAPPATWWASTPEHLTLRALAADGQTENPDRLDETRFLLGAARSAAPLDPAARFALAQPRFDEPGGPPSWLGLPHDVASRRLTARRLREAGKLDESLRAYRDALELVASGPWDGSRAPDYVDDRDVSRFRLPGEAAAAVIVAEMAGDDRWNFERWSAALPEHGLSRLAAYRLLRDRADRDADLAFKLASDHGGAGLSDPMDLAARAEALALHGDFEAARETYQAAVAGMDDGLARRILSANLGEVASRLGDVAMMRTAWRDAIGPSPDDVVNIRVGKARNREHLGAIADAPPGPSGTGDQNADEAGPAARAGRPALLQIPRP